MVDTASRHKHSFGRVLGSGPGLLRVSCRNPLNKKTTTVENLLLWGKPKKDCDGFLWDFPKHPIVLRHKYPDESKESFPSQLGEGQEDNR